MRKPPVGGLGIAILLPFVLALISPAVSLAGDERPIVVVFDINDKGVGLDKAVLARLSDYLSMQLAATGVYQVVPRDQLKKRLLDQKTESYKACYEQGCQIELGKELAAQKSMSSDLMKLGTKCVVSCALFDLKKAVTERGASVKGDCSEDGIVTSFEEMVKTLVSEKGAMAAVPHEPPVVEQLVPSSGAVVSRDCLLSILFEPQGADVSLDDIMIGQTPIHSRKTTCGRYKLRIAMKGRVTLEQVLELEEDRSLQGNLAIDEKAALEDRNYSTDWIRFSGKFGLLYMGGASLGLFRIKTPGFYYNILEGGIIYGGPLLYPFGQHRPLTEAGRWLADEGATG